MKDSRPNASDAPALTPTTRFLRKDGCSIAYAYTPGRAPTVVFLSGYASDMSGTKATFLETRMKSREQAFVRFDYQGHGESSGAFADGSIGLWSQDARELLEEVSSGPLVLVGSSMGAWIMLKVALALRNRIAALLGIASAPDFSEDLILPALSDAQRKELERVGRISLPSRYSDEPQVVTRRFVEEGRQQLVLRSKIDVVCPVRLIHGLEDPDVPWQTSLNLAGALRSEDVQLTLIKAGDHRLSTPRDLAIIGRTLESLIAHISSGTRS